MLLLFNLVLIGGVFAQRGVGGGGQAPPPGGPAELGFVCCCYSGIILFTSLPTIIGMWVCFEKAGEPGWQSIIPIYNLMVMARVAGRPESDGLLAALLLGCCGIGLIWFIPICIDFSRAFGKDVGFGIGLWLLGVVFWPLLAFTTEGYELGRGRVRKARRRRRRRDEEEDDEDRPRRRRRIEEDEEESPRRRSRVDDEDEDDLPRRRRPREDDEDDDDEGQFRRKPRHYDDD